MGFFDFFKKKEIDYTNFQDVFLHLLNLYNRDSDRISDVLQKIDPNMRDEFGNTLLIRMMMKSRYYYESDYFSDRIHYPIPELVSTGVDVNAQNDQGKTAPMYAMRMASVNGAYLTFLQELLKCNIDPFIKDIYGRTILDYAVRYVPSEYRNIITLMNMLRPAQPIPKIDETDQKLWRQFDKSILAYDRAIYNEKDEETKAQAYTQANVDWLYMIWHIALKQQQQINKEFSSVHERWSDLEPCLKKLSAFGERERLLKSEDLMPFFKKIACKQWHVVPDQLADNSNNEKESTSIVSACQITNQKPPYSLTQKQKERE